ncbi:hypothetical protein QMK19_41190 [Streptomyces sp. H10-C2]|uniref:hypothetical protein n=1 Tax=unclassified Streptomyces TaxID=2593676 RepID=UPI0024BA91C8|nr:MULTISPECIES: hypothetical protein [unclassified Streptomyces]MDJ0347640.1 hypothetical protein [Streptomyces sp. PH10-H1]MDJ0375811.1 hypothetical protein [Streptomyces sp. H10-C2]
MSVFDEYLADWDFGEPWKPVVEHLAARVATWPNGAPEPDEFLVDFPVDVLWTDGLLVWTTLVDPVLNGASYCLGGQIDLTGLRCGLLNPHNPGDSLDCRFVLLGYGRSLSELTDALLDWVTAQAGPPLDSRRFR